MALRRFWQTARGFWHSPLAWTLIISLVIGTMLQIVVQYRLNFWNRDFFNALEVCDSHQIWLQARILLLLAAASVSLAIAAVWRRMTFQHLWPDWRSGTLIEKWPAKQRYQRQAEADFKYVVARVNTRTTLDLHPEDAATLGAAQKNIIQQWRILCGQHMRITLVSHGNTLLAPIVGLILCALNYVLGTATLGEVTQAAAAFVAVQGAFNWLVDNFSRLAEWLSSANRVGTLLDAFDHLDAGESGAPT